MDVINSVTNGKLDNYMKERMQIAIANNESEVNTGQIEYCREFEGIMEDWRDYPISKSKLPLAITLLTQP